jgi:hypothetical protein
VARDGKALGLLSVRNPFRLAVAYLVHHIYFDRFIILCIFATSITLVIEQPDDWIRGSETHCPRAGLDCSVGS